MTTAMDEIIQRMKYRIENGYWLQSPPLYEALCPECGANDLNTFQMGNWTVTFGIKCWSCDFEIKAKDTTRLDSWARSRDASSRGKAKRDGVNGFSMPVDENDY